MRTSFMLEKLKSSATKLKQQLVALYLASRDRRTPWPGKILALCIVAYALSPIDLIPDVIPILGILTTSSWFRWEFTLR